MTHALFEDRGTPLARQRFTWRELAGKPISKLDDDAFTRVRVILMNGIETEAMRFSHAAEKAVSRRRFVRPYSFDASRQATRVTAFRPQFHSSARS